MGFTFLFLDPYTIWLQEEKWESIACTDVPVPVPDDPDAPGVARGTAVTIHVPWLCKDPIAQIPLFHGFVKTL